MKRFVVSTLTATCGFLLTTTAHASYVEKSFQSDPGWKTQTQVDAQTQVHIDARTAVPSDEATTSKAEQENGFDVTGTGATQFGQRLSGIVMSGSTVVTRAQFTAMLVRSKYTKESIDDCYKDITLENAPDFQLLFRDVPVGSEFAAEICVAMRDGLVRGYGNDIFKPDAAITFGDAAKILSRADGLTPWADASQPQHWFDTYVSALARRNAIPMSVTGIDKRITGSEAMEMITRLGTDDRTQPSRTADELIAAWVKRYETPKAPAVMTVHTAPKPSSSSTSTVTTSSAAAMNTSSAPDTAMPTEKSSTPAMMDSSTGTTDGSSSSRVKAWYEF